MSSKATSESPVIIKPVYYKLLIDSAENRKYIRLLETKREGWKKYLPELTRSKDRFLIYSWKKGQILKENVVYQDTSSEQLPSKEVATAPQVADNTPGSRFNMLMAFEVEQRHLSLQMNFVLVASLSSLIFLYLPSTAIFQYAPSILKTIIDGISVTLAYFGFVSAGAVLGTLILGLFTNFLSELVGPILRRK